MKIAQFGPLFAEQTEANIRQHALESACFFVVSATAWLDADQQAQIMKDRACAIGPISVGCFTAIASSACSPPGGFAEKTWFADVDQSCDRHLPAGQLGSGFNHDDTRAEATLGPSRRGRSGRGLALTAPGSSELTQWWYQRVPPIVVGKNHPIA